MVDAARQQHGAGGCQLGSLSNELSDDHLLARDALAASFTAWSEAIRAGPAAMIDNGSLPRDSDPGRLALALLAAVQGGLLHGQATAANQRIAEALGSQDDRQDPDDEGDADMAQAS